MANELDKGASNGPRTPSSVNPFEAPKTGRTPGPFWSAERWKHEVRMAVGFVAVIFVGANTMLATCGGLAVGVRVLSNSEVRRARWFVQLSGTTVFLISLMTSAWVMRRGWRAVKKSAEAARAKAQTEQPSELADSAAEQDS
jgi:hypothetical protein